MSIPIVSSGILVGAASPQLPFHFSFGGWKGSVLPSIPCSPMDITSEHPERFFVAEIVREKIFMQYRNEVPYACQVNVVKYISRPTSKDFIQVEIIVEKDSQKIILIGKEIYFKMAPNVGVAMGQDLVRTWKLLFPRLCEKLIALWALNDTPIVAANLVICFISWTKVCKDLKKS
ncbi:hypothetical protein COCNU_06G006800 [Cocos nucifera]|uniref:Uncharacterized protein n=1 Tax=Cocos nucifera TaxID=13894 RepID=A0A8K0N2R4_COCNU|nr:hypothetical protein COCNU_06G006800 [Cocos nucifera]